MHTYLQIRYVNYCSDTEHTLIIMWKTFTYIQDVVTGTGFTYPPEITIK